jgi:AcrR family transcriptional regulator
MPERRGYHHGNLRQALVAAARQLLAERGPDGFSLSDAAKLAGVSAAAPYRHFKDKDALLSEVAREGFASFADRLAAALRAHGDPMEAFRGMGRAYLAFAREEPGFYSAMFSRGVHPDHASQAARGEGAFRTLVDAIEHVYGGRVPAGIDPMLLAVQIWAFSHGIATLERSGRLAGGIDTDQMLIQGIEALLAGTSPSMRAGTAASVPKAGSRQG